MADSAQDFDDDLINEFSEEFRDAYELIEDTLIRLEEQPDSMELVNELFRHVHTVKGNLRMVEMNDIALFVHAIEEILDAIRNDQLGYDTQISDVTLTAMDTVQDMFMTAFDGRDLDDFDYLEAQHLLEQIPASGNGGYRHLAIAACRILNPDYVPEETDEAGPAPAAAIAEPDPTPVYSPARDLVRFHQLAIRLEERVPVLSGRTERLLELTEAINNQAGQPVDAQQLAAAVCLHDIDLARLDAEAIANADSSNPAYRQHPLNSAAVFERFPGWETAATIVSQHHEQIDGNGFPEGLSGQSIHAGARILAISEHFDRILQNKDEMNNASIVDSLRELQSLAGSIFGADWLQPLIQAIRTQQVPHLVRHD